MFLTGVILSGIGVIFLGVGVFMAVRLARFLGTAVATRGKVVGFVEQSSDEGGSTTHARVEFAAADGSAVTFTETSQTRGKLALGAEVPVKYDPSAPAKARIATGGRLWVTPIIMIGLGAVLLVVGVILLVVG